MSGKQAQKGGGFMSFVNSIITDKVKYTTNQDKLIQKQSEGSGPTSSLVPKDSQTSDLALIQSLQKNQQPNGKSVISSSKDDSLLRGSHGLGYQATQSELEQATQIQRLKNQIKQQTQKEEEVSVKRRIEADDDSRVLQVGQKRQKSGGDFKSQMIDERQEKKRNKKMRQKNKKEQEKEKANETQKAAQEDRQHQHQESEEQKKEEGQPLRQERVRIRTKTRSNQKNRKKDNRPIEVIRAKLAEKGIII